MAENPYINKVEYAGQTLMDLTGDTATPSDVLNGATFHDRSGAPQTGNLITHDVYDGLDSASTSDALSAKQGKVLNDKITNINNIIGKYVYGQSGSIETYLGTLPSDEQWVATITNNSSTGSLVTLSGQHLFSITQFCSSDNTKYQIAVAVNTPYVYYRIYRWYNSSWSDWYELERKIQVVSTGSKTISGNGNINYTFNNKVLVLGAYSTSSDIVCSAYPSSGADSSGSATWWIHCRNANSSGSVASGTITCYIIYIDMA